MSKLIICDRCGRAIVGEPYIPHLDHKGGDGSIEEQLICRRSELCRTCAAKVATVARDGRRG